MSQNRLLTIGIPVRNEEANIPELKKKIEALVHQLEKENLDVEIIVNENCSSDDSLAMLRAWEMVDHRVKVHQLKFPVSFQETILMLMAESSGDAFVIFQSDLQDPVEIIPLFVERWLLGADIVAGVAINRAEGFFDKAGRKLFYFALKNFSDGKFIPGFQDFYLLSKAVYSQVATLPRSGGAFIRGYLSSSFGNIDTLEYSRSARLAGKSNFNFASKYALALDGLLLFGTKFVRLISVSSFVLFAFSLLGIAVIFALYIIGFRFGVRGWTSILIILLSYISLFGLVSGVVLEYLIRIYRSTVFRK